MDFFYGIALSLHLGMEGEYQPLHPNVGLSYNNFMVGAYYNSESNVSYYLAYEYEISENTSVELGLVEGYSINPVIPMLKVNYKYFFIVPAVEKYNGEINPGMVIGIEKRF